MKMKPIHPVLLVIMFFVIEVIVVAGVCMFMLLIIFGVLTGCQNIMEVFQLLFN